METPECFRKLKAAGGYGLTHIGSIQKTDGAAFSGQEAREILDTLRLFFSFAKGSWCNPVCPVGFDDAENRVWELWSYPREVWTIPYSSWFDPHHPEQLVALLPGFMVKRENKNWRAALSEVLYWYLNSNQSARGIDAGIILTQSAIERLAYEYMVKDQKLITAKKFKKLNAADNYRRLFSALGIPVDIPSFLSEISTLAMQRKWRDGPHALTDIRNAIVHPDHIRHGQDEKAYFEAWNLGLQYLELAILAICGYNGAYYNRIGRHRLV